METKISIKLKINDVTIELTVDEAKRLAGVLNELVGKKETECVLYPYPSYPYGWMPPWKWTITGSNATGTYSVNPNTQVTYTCDTKVL